MSILLSGIVAGPICSLFSPRSATPNFTSVLHMLSTDQKVNSDAYLSSRLSCENLPSDSFESCPKNDHLESQCDSRYS